MAMAISRVRCGVLSWLAIGALLLALPGCSDTPCDCEQGEAQPDADIAALEESETDLLGLHALPGSASSYGALMDAGARVVNLTEAGTFFLIWVPQDYAELPERRVMIAMHGTAGTAYAEAGAELALAQEHQYAILAIQWWLAQPEAYLEPPAVLGIIDLGLRYLEYYYGAEPRRSAYEGFSRGSAIGYEVTFWDRQLGTNYLALTIGHSGGVPLEGGRPFFDDLAAGVYGDSAFAGTHFFLYCGLQDEVWGEQQCAHMRNARDIVRAQGATIDSFIQDPHGSHNGYHADPENHEAAVALFLSLTAER
ncbi:MAG: hypothetical protein GF330_14060 [Candidatus Eisenbacteria bacterium]|nr:hypothetical protein [Candidatus Eisenbacteria bacterium]